ncbi:acyl-CoA desaturase [Salinisphaera sp. LB1]|uniref:fatty acid desaturase family protein n=1 Tax=Salinisphaera sp. LB1 TaxID=2183911 RepID=UPI000D705295|nr:acyl-CoA desaturase [Salinisphaera sp. LB1]AWN17201.1 putative linoleoyl-CoA desaturase (delta(6)-desaturase) [Salinisphaera sp. LB1]
MSKPTHLSEADLTAFGQALDQIRDDVMSDLGERDARYILRVLRTQRASEVAGRALLFAGLLPPAWLAGTSLLALSKILENMEIGHNVMHGQWDWMNDPALDSATYEWDNTCPSAQWKHSHNYVHHTFTNIVDLDRDLGYTLLRVSEDQAWEPRFLAQPGIALLLAAFFQWGVALHDLEFERLGRDKSWKDMRAQAGQILAKVRGQLLKDYLLFPTLAGPLFAPVLAGNLSANFTRNIWSFLIIFCGHFTDEVEMYDRAEATDESRGQWYLRQLLGSSNLTGSVPFHVLSGHLSYQIEHHLFPDMPSHRYREIAPRVQALCAEYGINYNTGSLARQAGGVARRILRMSLPGRRRRRVTNTAADFAEAA